MKQAYGISGGALATALPGMLFCIWTALGNEVAFCVTAGCSLYQDLVIGGLSMWWIGTAAFGVLACLALLGAVPAGHFLAGLTLLGDIFLLLLMALTSPCVSCLVVACFFALTYWLFRRALHRDDRRPQERSLLLCAWLVLFVVNAGQVVRMQGEVWSISENSDQATVRMFFSPSCSACREGIGILSGSVDVAFCPVAENDADVARVERMLLLLEEGKPLKEAVAACQNVEEPGPWAFLHPGQWGLRLRLQRNRAHIFNAGSRTVPFFEYHGLPAMLKKQAQPPAPARAQEPVIEFSPAGGQTFPDAVLPLEPQVAGQCGGPAPCP